MLSESEIDEAAPQAAVIINPTNGGIDAANHAAPVVAAPAVFEPPEDEFNFETQWDAATVESILHTWGGIYIGEWKHDQPHGWGTMQLRNEQVRWVCKLSIWTLSIFTKGFIYILYFCCCHTIDLSRHVSTWKDFSITTTLNKE